MLMTIRPKDETPRDIAEAVDAFLSSLPGPSEKALQEAEAARLCMKAVQAIGSSIVDWRSDDTAIEAAATALKELK